MKPAPDSTVIYTDGACKGNPGPGGWAWAVVDGGWASGFEPEATNQRMEITAAYQAVLSNEGPVHVVSDSTYVVNCFRDQWWKGWEKRKWKNSKGAPVANRDLWEPFIELVRERGATFDWVKGHSGDQMNDIVDRLAVAAIERRTGGSGERPPSSDDLGPPDAPGLNSPRLGSDMSVGGLAEGPAGPAVRDGRIPSGSPFAVVGVRSAKLSDSPRGKKLRNKLSEILGARAQMNSDLVVLTGLRPGAEQIAALAASDAGVPYVVVLPYPDPVAGFPAADRAEFESLAAAARSVVTLESKRPTDSAGKTAALARRDGWLRSVSIGALVVTDSSGSVTGGGGNDQLAKFVRVLGDEVWDLRLEEFD